MSFRSSFLAKDAELVSVSSRAMTTTGSDVAVAFLAALVLKTSILTSSKDFGDSGCAVKATRQEAGESVSLCSTDSAGLIERAARV